MTEREFLTKVMNLTKDTDMVEFARNRITKLDNRNTQKANKSKANNEPFKKMILDFLNGKEWTVGSDIAKALELTTQKVVGLCGSMVKGGILERQEISIPKIGKRIAYKIKE